MPPEQRPDVTVAAMATMLICDGCGATGGSTRPVPRVGYAKKKNEEPVAPEWWVVTLSGSVTSVKSYDLCPECFGRAESAVFLTVGPAEKAPARIRGLSPVEIGLLHQIWQNAQGFDQSIGDIK